VIENDMKRIDMNVEDVEIELSGISALGWLTPNNRERSQGKKLRRTNIRGQQKKCL